VDDFWSKKATHLDERWRCVCARNGSKGNADAKVAPNCKEPIHPSWSVYLSAHILCCNYAIKPRVADGSLLVFVHPSDDHLACKLVVGLVQAKPWLIVFGLPSKRKTQF
jgi:hypothetical protein